MVKSAQRQAEQCEEKKVYYRVISGRPLHISEKEMEG